MPDAVQDDEPYSHQEYPKAVYRDRESPAPDEGGWVPAAPYETETVLDEAEELEALEAGWRLTPEEPEADEEDES